MRFLTINSVLLFATLSLFARCGQQVPDDSITVEQVRQRVQNDSTLLFLDVRSDAEFHGPLGHLPGALLIPLPELEQRQTELEKYREQTIVVICRSGNRSGKATKLLREWGYQALNMTGGMIAWNKMLETMNEHTSGVANEKVNDK